jgi:hypothetical protein
MAKKFTLVKMGLTGAILFFLVFTRSSTEAQADKRQNDKPDSERAKAQVLWEATIKAKGGREKLHRINAIYVISEAGNQRYHQLLALPDCEFMYLYFKPRESTILNIYNGKRGINWWQPGSASASIKYAKDSDVEYDFPIKASQIVYLLSTLWLEPKPVQVRKERIGLKRIDVIETDWSGWRIDYFIDSQSQLPIKIAYGSSTKRNAQAMNREIELGEYREVTGVMLPHKLRVSHTTNSSKWEERLRFEINPEYDEQIFENAPTPKMGPEAWRPKPQPKP